MKKWTIDNVTGDLYCDNQLVGKLICPLGTIILEILEKSSLARPEGIGGNLGCWYWVY